MSRVFPNIYMSTHSHNPSTIGSTVNLLSHDRAKVPTYVQTYCVKNWFNSGSHSTLLQSGPVFEVLTSTVAVAREKVKI
jgi:hypothetical protein